MNVNEERYEKLVRLTKFVLSSEEPFPSLRGIAVDWIDNTIQIYFYNDGEILAELENDYSCIGTELVAHYGQSHIHEEMIRLDYPTPLPSHPYWAFRRQEPPPQLGF